MKIASFAGLFCVGVSILLSSPNALAWGDEGHSVVALIAQQILQGQASQDPKAAKTLASIKTILAGTPIDQAAIWPDKVKTLARECAQPPYVKDSAFKDGKKGSAICDAYSFTSGWHFINSDTSTYAIDPKRQDYFKGDMVVLISGISHVLKGENATVLTNVSSYNKWKQECLKKTDHACKKEALEFLIHLVGDLHQPLHAGAECDAGANAQQISFFGQDDDPGAFWCEARKPKNPSDAKYNYELAAYKNCLHHELHQAWDVNLWVKSPLKTFKNAQEYASDLVKSMSARSQAAGGKSCVQAAPGAPVKVDGPNGAVDWANESLCYMEQVYDFPDDPRQNSGVTKDKAKRAVAATGVNEIANRCRRDRAVLSRDENGQVIMSHGVERTDYYKPFDVGPKYFAANLPVINDRLYLAGTRLAGLLREIYGDGDKASALEP